MYFGGYLVANQTLDDKGRLISNCISEVQNAMAETLNTTRQYTCKKHCMKR